MRRRSYAVVFALVLLLVLGGGFLGGRYLIRQLQRDFGPRATWTPPTQTVAGAVQRPTITPLPAARSTQTPTRVAIVAPTPVGIAMVSTVSAPAVPTDALPDETAAPPDEEMTPVPTSTALPDASPTPALPTPVFQFVLASAVRHTAGDCPGSYILGQVSDRAGNPLPGVQLLLADEYGNQERKATKSGVDAGRYDFPLFPPPRRFFLAVVDDTGRPISPQIEIAHGAGAAPSATCHWVYWRRQ